MLKFLNSLFYFQHYQHLRDKKIMRIFFIIIGKILLFRFSTPSTTTTKHIKLLFVLLYTNQEN